MIQAESQADSQLEQLKHQNNMEKMNLEFQMKAELIKLEQGMKNEIKQGEMLALDRKEQEREDRKDKRTKIQATQQSKMIDQRNKGEGAIDFEEEDDLMGIDELFSGI